MTELDPTRLDPIWLADVVRQALDEDLGGPDGVDVTSIATISDRQTDTAEVIARADGVVAGLAVFEAVWQDVSGRLGCPPVAVECLVTDGDAVQRDDVLLRAHGSTQALLIGERTALNLACRASGVATATRQWARELSGTGAQVLDTRKTTPGLRELEKYAVRCGGGTNKRMGLHDVAMIKDNHKLAAGSIAAAYQAVRTRYPQVPVQVEVTTTAEAIEAVTAGARFLLCDNMSIELLRQTVVAARAAVDQPEQLELEATGGLTLAVARAYGETGVDYLSVGGLTHSSPILDLALDLVQKTPNVPEPSPAE
jgi:nicotinate-nucleotide pyrophosphorylase (carboxylating)